MINYSSNPTNEKVIEMFRSDAIGRNQEILRFINLLDSIDDFCSIALNGQWGSGKTFFVKQVKMILDFSNPYSDMDDGMRSKVKSVLPLSDFECSQSYATVYYDAWANDNSEDPILSLVYAAINSNQVDFEPERKKHLTDIVAALADAVTGRSVSNLFEKFKGADLFESIKKEKDIEQLISNFVQTLIAERANQVVIFIDELDRCKPTYAIQLLERIKHYFDDDKIIFVFSVNLSQLQHTVKGYYGSDFDATRYLDKFFDLRVALPEINYDTYLRNRFTFIQSMYIYDKVCIEVIKYYRFSLRETERFIRLIKIAAYKQTHSNYYGGFADEQTYQFVLIHIIPIMIGLSMVDIEAYSRFIAGVDSGPLLEILLRSEKTLSKSMLLGAHECFSEKEKRNETDTVISVENRLKEVYHALFSNAFGYGREKYIGPMEFSARTRDEINKIVSLLSPDVDYDVK